MEKELIKQLSKFSKKELIDCIEAIGYFRPHGKGPKLKEKNINRVNEQINEVNEIDKEFIIASIVVPYLLLNYREHFNIAVDVSNLNAIENFYNNLPRLFIYQYRGFNELNREYKNIMRSIEKNMKMFFNSYSNVPKFYTFVLNNFNQIGQGNFTLNQGEFSDIINVNNRLKLIGSDRQFVDLDQGNTIPYYIGKYNNNFEWKYQKIIKAHTNYNKLNKSKNVLNLIESLKTIVFIQIRPQDQFIIREFGVAFPNNFNITVGIGDQPRLIIRALGEIAFIPLQRIKKDGIYIFKLVNKSHDIFYIKRMLNDQKVKIEQFKNLLQKKK